MAVLTGFRNPVLWQEITHQERGMRRWRKRWAWVGYALVISLVIMTALTLQDYRYSTRETATFCIWAVHISAAIFSIVAGANVISREHVGATWDSLVLTGVSARQILIGKWNAALRRAGGWLIILGAIRLAMIPVYTLALINRFAWFGYNYYSRANSPIYGDSEIQFEIQLVVWAVLLAVAGTVLLTLLEILTDTALGMAASAVARRGGLAIILGIVIRFLPVAMFAGFTLYQFRDVPYRGYRWWRFTPFSLADGGTSSIYQLSLPSVTWTQGRHAEAIPGLLLAAGLLILLLGISLFVTWMMIRRTGALPEPQRQQVECGI